MIRRRSFLASVGTAALAGCGSTAATAAFRVPEAVLLDDRFDVALSGLPPRSTVQVTARAEDGLNYTPTWSASATFRSTAEGTLSLAEQAPLSGSYEGTDPMGLFWSMETDEPPAEAFFPPRDHEVTLTAHVDGDRAARTTVRRRVAVDGVESTPLGDLVGTMHTPPGEGPAPGVLLLHGSSGRELTATARLLSSHGFVACSLRYFGGPDSLPDTLAAVPVEYARRGVDRLLAHPRVAGPQVGVWGVSKGAELALLLASHDDRIGAVVGVSPATVVWEGFDREGYPAGTSSWTVDGEPVPYVPLAAFEDVPGDPTESPRSLYEYSQLRADPERIAGATIPVERIRGSVALVSGTDDNQWHSTAMADRAVDRLAARDHPHEFVHRSFEGAGHAFPLPYLPTYGTTDTPAYPLGGDPTANARASEGHWRTGTRTLADLEAGFTPDPPPVTPDDPRPALTWDRGVLAATLLAGALGVGAAFRRTQGELSDESVTGFLRSTSANVSLAVASIVAGSGLVIVGRPGYAALMVLFAFLFLNDELSMRGWDWLRARLVDREPEPDTGARTLRPHRPSATTKVIVILGTGLFVWLVLVGSLVAYVLS